MPDREMVMKAKLKQNEEEKKLNKPATGNRDFAKGNQWWKLRSKHGRDKIFQTPAILWQACLEYFEKTDERKWIKTEFNGKDAIECHVPTDTPYTITGLYVFLDIVKSTWYEYRSKEGYSDVITRVEQIIYTQKLEGAAVGAFNANIIARELGLKETQDVNLNDNRKAVADLFPLDENEGE